VEKGLSLPHVKAWKQDRGMVVLSIDDVIKAGHRVLAPTPMVIPGKDGWEENPLSNLCFTSGSTGMSFDNNSIEFIIRSKTPVIPEDLMLYAIVC